MIKHKSKRRPPRRPPTEPPPRTSPPPPRRRGVVSGVMRGVHRTLAALIVCRPSGVCRRFLITIVCWQLIGAGLLAGWYWQQTCVTGGHWLRLADYYQGGNDALLAETRAVVSGLAVTLVIAFGVLPALLGCWLPLCGRPNPATRAEHRTRGRGWLTAGYWLWWLGFATIGAAFWLPLDADAAGWIAAPPLLVWGMPTPRWITAQQAWLLAVLQAASGGQILVGYLLMPRGPWSLIEASGQDPPRPRWVARGLLLAAVTISIASGLVLFAA